MNINSNTTSAIVVSLFRLVRDGSALHGPVGAGVIGKQTALYPYGSLSGCFSVLSADRLMLALMHLEQACCATLVNQNMKRIVT